MKPAMRSRGFTLIELMVTFGLLAVMLVVMLAISATLLVWAKRKGWF